MYHLLLGIGSKLKQSESRKESAFLPESSHMLLLRRALLSFVVVVVLHLSYIAQLNAAPPLPTETQLVTGDVLQSLRLNHPRLFFTLEDLPRINRAIAKDAVVQKWYNQLEQSAQEILTEPPVEYKLIGPRLLRQSRAALRRISTLAGLYHIDRDRRWLTRARTELLAAAALPDWHPAHFLDTAEMTTAVALGYDWLHDFLSVEDRATIRRALIEKGLRPGLDAYVRGSEWTKENQRVAWTEVDYNWSQVCNGGMMVGALAIADEEPLLATAIVKRASRAIVAPMRQFAPDGGYEEGPRYWYYGTRYNVFLLAALKSALGTDFGLMKMPGFADTGWFRMHLIGPLGKTFNYADGDDRIDSAAQMLWLGREFNRPMYTAHERLVSRDQPEIFHLLWSSEHNPELQELNVERDRLFRNVDVAFFRSAWEDIQATYIGFKGGDNQASHSHLDLGSFVLDANGERWALDLGADQYSLPGYFNRKQRWNYYRLRTESHNTLTIDRQNQNPAGRAPIVAYLSTPDRAFAVTDLTAGYQPPVIQAQRGIALLQRQQVLVQDEVKTRAPAEVTWNFHTRAQIKLQGNRATLVQNQRQLTAQILSPPGARFEVISSNPAPPPQSQQPDVQNLQVRLPQKTTDVRIAVLLTPGDSTATPKIAPLTAWIAAGKLP